MKLYSLPLSPFASRVRFSIYRKGMTDIEIVPPPEGGLKTEAFLGLSPMGRVVVNRVSAIYEIPDLISRYSRLNSYWKEARLEPINARVIAEQLAVAPK